MYALKIKSAAALPAIAMPHHAQTKPSGELSRQELRAIILAMIG